MKSPEKVTLVQGQKIVIEDIENAEILNKFFFQCSKELKIPRFHTTDPLVDHIYHSTLTDTLKFQNHPSVSVIRNAVNYFSGNTFSLS